MLVRLGVVLRSLYSELDLGRISKPAYKYRVIKSSSFWCGSGKSDDALRGVVGVMLHDSSVRRASKKRGYLFRRGENVDVFV